MNKVKRITIDLRYVFALCGLFVFLQLSEIVNWSWWLVLSPLWGTVIFVILAVIGVSIMEFRQKRKVREIFGEVLTTLEKAKEDLEKEQATLKAALKAKEKDEEEKNP